jgi:hypothetical protein
MGPSSGRPELVATRMQAASGLNFEDTQSLLSRPIDLSPVASGQAGSLTMGQGKIRGVVDREEVPLGDLFGLEQEGSVWVKSHARLAEPMDQLDRDLRLTGGNPLGPPGRKHGVGDLQGKQLHRTGPRTEDRLDPFPVLLPERVRSQTGGINDGHGLLERARRRIPTAARDDANASRELPPKGVPSPAAAAAPG